MGMRAAGGSPTTGAPGDFFGAFGAASDHASARVEVAGRARP
ncbi:MAG: hypothetical protein M0Z33_09845 [Actinomycetota bacterium]|nr:hypothetical protein [Actinomycetota bacterium]